MFLGIWYDGLCRRRCAGGVAGAIFGLEACGSMGRERISRRRFLGGAAAFKLTGQVNSDVVDGKIRSDAPPAQLYDLKKDTLKSHHAIKATFKDDATVEMNVISISDKT